MSVPIKPTDEEEVANPPVVETEELDDLDQSELELQQEVEQELDDLVNGPDAPVEEAPAAPVERQPSRREQLRVQDLLRKYTPPEQPQPQAPAPSPNAMDYNSELEADPEMIARLQADREAAAQAAYQRGLQQSNAASTALAFETRLEIDAPRVTSKYPFLDPDSPSFDPVAAEDLNLMYLDSARYDQNTRTVGNPELRYSAFADALVGLANRIADKKVQTSTKNIVKQAAHTGLRPDGSRAKRIDLSKAPEDMTDEELDAVISAGLRS